MTALVNGDTRQLPPPPPLPVHSTPTLLFPLLFPMSGKLETLHSEEIHLYKAVAEKHVRIALLSFLQLLLQEELCRRSRWRAGLINRG